MVTREINFFNPSNKTIIYSINIYGSKNFTIENDNVKIEPK